VHASPMLIHEPLYFSTSAPRPVFSKSCHHGRLTITSDGWQAARMKRFLNELNTAPFPLYCKIKLYTSDLRHLILSHSMIILLSVAGYIICISKIFRCHLSFQCYVVSSNIIRDALYVINDVCVCDCVTSPSPLLPFLDPLGVGQ
jgi:hypothetical protein